MTIKKKYKSIENKSQKKKKKKNIFYLFKTIALKIVIFLDLIENKNFFKLSLNFWLSHAKLFYKLIK